MTIAGRQDMPLDQALTVADPASGLDWAIVPRADDGAVASAVSAARAAFDGEWSQLSATRRGETIYRMADVIEQHAAELAELEVRSSGKLHREAVAQVNAIPRWFRYYGGMADKIDGRVPSFDMPGVINLVTREPLGVVAAISAWNSPLMLSIWKVAPALAAGNTVVLKPSELASPAVLRLGGLFELAGFPPGVVNVISGDAATGTALVTHPDVDFVTFTGGPRTASLIAHSVADNLTPTAFELGGKSANILMDDCDLDAAIPGLVAGIFAASGQTCVAGSRGLVQSGIYDEVERRMADYARAIRVGDPFDADTQAGPLISEQHLGTVAASVAGAVEQGAVLVAGGHRVVVDDRPGGAYYAPTVLGGVTTQMDVAQREIFGPVLSLMRFDDEAEAITIANSTGYGLAAGIWTRDVKRAHRMANSIKAGTVWVNTYRAMSPLAPQGGSGLSGYGREGGTEAIQEFTQTKSVWIETSENARDPFVVNV